MRTNSMTCLITAILAVGIMIPAAGAPERTTPVRVTNLLGIDPNNNTVKAQQSGLWNVAVTQSGTWNVGINNTPSVNVANTPNVSITNTPTVNTPTQHNILHPWTSNPTIPAGDYLFYGPFDCAGFKELRVAIRAMFIADETIRVEIGFYNSSGSGYNFGMANFGSPLKSVSDQANWSVSPSLCTFSVPTIGDRFYMRIHNGSASARQFSSGGSWVYMVD